MLREALGVSITSRDSTVYVRGDRSPVSIARRVLEKLGEMNGESSALSRQEVLNLISDETVAEDRRAKSGSNGTLDDPTVAGPSLEEWDGRLAVFSAGRPVRPKTSNQQAYVEAIRDHDLVFCVGPAGTGKTYLAVAAAVHLLKTDRCRKLILVRPAVEAGEKLGYLPGDLQAKVNPYLRPLLDALHDMMDFGTIQRFMASDVIEVVPLAYMRGRTLNNAVIILDEAQNTTKGQMKMFLTRLGHGSKMIVTGDTTQIDLPDPRESGLIDAARRLSRTPGIGFSQLTKLDVVRHPIVQRIIEAYGDDAAGSAAHLNGEKA
ncbi:MAG: PhoH family protein [Phycisphaeraceae bacterium]|nr:PhoH family protein [Phycisphaeraceae bacterium]